MILCFPLFAVGRETYDTLKILLHFNCFATEPSLYFFVSFDVHLAQRPAKGSRLSLNQIINQFIISEPSDSFYYETACKRADKRKIYILMWVSDLILKSTNGQMNFLSFFLSLCYNNDDEEESFRSPKCHKLFSLIAK